MRTPTRIPSRLTPLAFACWLIVAAPAALQAQTVPSASSGSRPDEVNDLALSTEERGRFIGLYSVTTRDTSQAPMSIRLFEAGDALMGQVDSNAPTRMLYQGSNAFRPEAAVAFVITFTVEGDIATRLSMVSPEGTMEGVRVTEESGRDANGQSDPSTAGVLYEELVRLDSLLFDAAYVACDAQAVNALLTDDVEFYHDKTGFHSRDQVRADFQRLTRNCPRIQGVARELVEGSLRVYPIKDYGAVQMGVHRFVRSDGSVGSIARFVHLWKKKDGLWRIARVLSFDHRNDDSVDANILLRLEQ